MLETGKKFPSFSLPGSDNKTHSLSEFAGNWLVVYFYPKDNTSGCSLEARNFAALFASFAGHRASVVGVSPDSVKSHCNFAAKLDLPFILLSDPEHVLLSAAGVWQSKKMCGREYMGVVRTTALIDPQGKTRHVWNKVRVAGHAEAVYQKLSGLAEAKDLK
jgi:peroxiredoxin Q/BCP